jgi:hypothetical protein
MNLPLAEIENTFYDLLHAGIICGAKILLAG